MTEERRTVFRPVRPAATAEPRRLVRDQPMMREVRWDQVDTRLDELDQGNFDIATTASSLRVNDAGLLEINSGSLVEGAPDKVELYGFTDWSFTQLAQMAGIPSNFLKKSPTGHGKASKRALIEKWLENKSTAPVLLRMKRNPLKVDENGNETTETLVDEKTGTSGHVRGILSGHTVPFGMRDAVTAIRPWALQYGMKIQLGNMTERSAHLRLIFPEFLDLSAGHGESQSTDDGILAPGDLHSLGVHLATSEVGYRSLTVDLMVFRLVCTNGMITQSDRTSLYHRRQANLDPSTVRQELGIALEEARSKTQELTDRLKDLKLQVLPEPELTLESFLRSNGAPASFIADAKEAWKKEPVKTKFGILQAVTRAAQRSPIDVRTEYERLAGQYLLRS